VPDTFRDLQEYIALPRVADLALSPDGARLVTTVSTLDPERKKFVSALWEVDARGNRPARRLTLSAPGETHPAFLPSSDLLFTSKRPDPDVKEPDEEVAALWLLPAGGGEARQVASRPGGVAAVEVARDAGTVVLTAPVLATATDADDDKDRRKARKDADVNAVLHEGYPVRYWDHDLGPDELRLYAAAPPANDGRLDEPRELTPKPGRGLDDQKYAVAPDGSYVVTGWQVLEPGGDVRVDLVRIDVETGDRITLISDEAYEHYAPAVSPDGRQLVCLRERRPTYDEPFDVTLVLLDADGSRLRDLTPDLDLMPEGAVWSADGSAVYFVASEHGHLPAFRVDVASRHVTRLSRAGAYDSLRPSPDGKHLYAIRSAIDAPPAPVRLDARAPDQDPAFLPGPAGSPPLPGTLTEITAAADDGQELRSWLVLPDGAVEEQPAPLLLVIHGGPESSWNAWSWRWCPWLFAARGYAVLLPDPALSTGYGVDFLRRGWNGWGDRPYTDLMTITDAAEKRPDLDVTRTAALGGSFGGYMANWVAGHTDRFRAIVTHASLWSLEQFGATTDVPSYWARRFGDPVQQPDRYRDNSPDGFIQSIVTPMLVIHGDRDYRVPIGEALRLYWDLVRHGKDARFLYYPDENHWILKPGDIVVWYETVLAFLDEHVLGRDATRSRLL
jgi:dipeptidyl aminopeptidase/acylaminoacyl peptidase